MAQKHAKVAQDKQEEDRVRKELESITRKHEEQLKKEKEKGALQESKAEVVAEAWTKALQEPRASRHLMKSSSAQENSSIKADKEGGVAVTNTDEIHGHIPNDGSDKNEKTHEIIDKCV